MTCTVVILGKLGKSVLVGPAPVSSSIVVVERVL
jgi:hypothetical protein